MNRREFVGFAALGAVASKEPQTLVVPVRRVVNSRAHCTPEEWNRFWWTIWPETVRGLGRCGIQLQTTDVTGEIKLSPADKPIFVGVERGFLNLVLTDTLPLDWDSGRALAGVTTLHEGYHLSVIALRYARAHRVPYVSLNTCLHEILHALLGDIFVPRPKWYQTGEREIRDDWYGTDLWLFHRCEEIRKMTRAYIERLRLETPPPHFE